MEVFGHVIDGEERFDGAASDSVDPHTREPWAQVALGGAVEADLAVTAARKAFDEGPWPRMGFAERGALIHRFASLLEEHVDELAMADTRDMGKPISDWPGATPSCSSRPSTPPRLRRSWLDSRWRPASRPAC